MTTNDGAESSSFPSPFGKMPLGRFARRESVASIDSQRLDKGALRQALNEIHQTASQSEALTTFHEFASPPPSASRTDSRGIAGDLVHSGLGGIYNRFKDSVTAAKDAVGRPPSSRGEDVTMPRGLPTPRTAKSQDMATMPNSSATAKTSPVIASRVQSGLQSPISDTFQQSHLSSRQATLSSDASVFEASPSPEVAPERTRPMASKGSKPEDPRPPNSVLSSRSKNEGQNGEFERSDRTATKPASDNTTPVSGKSSSAVETQRLTAITASAEGIGKPAKSSPQSLGEQDRQDIDPKESSSPSVSSNLSGQSQRLKLENRSQSGHKERPPFIKISQPSVPNLAGLRVPSPDIDGSSVSTMTASSQVGKPRPAELQLPSEEQYEQDLSRARAYPQRRVLSKKFWMKDENARDCFYCGDPFTTFRRKHHCRVCGQIFDSKCTSMVSGKPFGYAGSLRVCTPCQKFGSKDKEDDSSDEYSERASIRQKSPIDLRSARVPKELKSEDLHSIAIANINTKLPSTDVVDLPTPSFGIPGARRATEKKRRSTVIEFDDQHTLARPSSSRSLKSWSGRPRSSSHKHHLHQHMRSPRPPEKAPFQRGSPATSGPHPLHAFHNDSIIDPDLAPFMSDEDSSAEEQMSLFDVLNKDSSAPLSSFSETSAIGNLLNAVKKARPRTRDRSVGTNSIAHRDAVGRSLTSANLPRFPRKRNLSAGSADSNERPSPRRSRSTNVLGNLASDGQDILNEDLSINRDMDPAKLQPSGRMRRSASLRGSSAPIIELNAASLQHVKKLLKQLLKDAEVPHTKSWEKALFPILLQCTDDVDPDIQRGDDIDIRHYVKLKKITGGRPADTSYISGVVFSKNVALKSMPRYIGRPKVMIVTFPIEYARHQQHFMSLDPVLAQEREYLKNLVSRIITAGPTVLLVQRNVSGMALRFLDDANIAVAFNVKESVLNAVSRCLQTRMITSVDKLAVGSTHLGTCASFQVKTFVSNGLRKSYIYLLGSKPNLGCTIALRGADMEVLQRIKRITEFMCYVVYNLKLETCLMRDEFVLIPTSTEPAKPAPTVNSSKQQKPSEIGVNNEASRSGVSLMGKKSSLDHGEESKSSADNVSAAAANESSRGRLNSRDEGRKDSVDAEDDVPEDVPMPTYYSDMVDKHQSRILSSSPFVQFVQPYMLMTAREQERRVAYLKTLRDRYAPGNEPLKTDSPKTFQLIKPEMVHTEVENASKQVREFLHAVHDAQYEKALHYYLTQRRQWEAYISTNLNLFDPYTHQNIAVLYSLVSTVTSVPCFGPDIIALNFYGEHEFDSTDGFDADCTLGQYIEDLCYSAPTVCKGNACGKRMFDHHRQYVHGEGQLSIFVQKYPSRIRGLQNTILMWSVCRICAQETQIIPMSGNTWKYSFGKYLELSFWSSELHPRASVCPHDIHRNHVRYFGFQDVAIRIQYDKIELYEVIVPRTTITWKVDTDLRMKNTQFQKIQSRLDKFMDSVKLRLSNIRTQSVGVDNQDACKEDLERLKRLADSDHHELTEKLQQQYLSSKYYEIIPLNRGVRAIWEKALQWDDYFYEFEQSFLPSEKDIRRLATQQLRKMFIERTGSVSSLTSLVDSENQTAPSEAEKSRFENDSIATTPTMISRQATRELMDSVVREDLEKSKEDANKGSNTAESSEVLPSAAQNEHPDETVNSGDTVEQAPNLSASKEFQHLDLAIPTASSPSVAKADVLQPDYPGIPQISQGTPMMGNGTDDAPIPSTTDTETISTTEKFLTKQDGYPSLPQSSTESKIPKPREANMSRRAPGSPPLLRAKSYPAKALQRQQTAASVNSLTSPSGPVTAALVNELDNGSRSSLYDSTISTEKKRSERMMMSASKTGKLLAQSMIPRNISSRRIETRVSALAKHFEQLSREFEKERIRERRQRLAVRTKQARQYPIASYRPVVEVYQSAREALQDRDHVEEETPSQSKTNVTDSREDLPPDDTSSGTTFNLPDTRETSFDNDSRSLLSSTKKGDNGDQELDTSLLDERATNEAEAEMSDSERLLDDAELRKVIVEQEQLSPSETQLDLALELPRHEKHSLMDMLTSFWSERSASGWEPLEYPLHPSEHVWADSDIIIREDEPSCIIALALSSADYQAKVKQFRNSPRPKVKSMPTAQEQQTPLNLEDTLMEQSLLANTGTNMKYSFQYGSIRAQCKIFYAESFDALRRKCGVADRFIESLSRCMKWDSKGGKSKSLFIKTMDDRFVLKSLSKVEIEHFTKFAPDYFSFMAETMFHGMPSVIAKMFGLFHVVIKNATTGVEFNWFLLVMENLFYDRSPTRRFDLKGSMRNRKIESTGEADEVLLDENLVDTIYESPLFVREHSKRILKASVYNDTLFLSKQNVMDYSLMAGIDDKRRELVVGIIDCIRTYTWDKKLESWIKDRGKNKPTITSPKDYRNRFRVSISNYFLHAPNCWHQYQSQPIHKHSAQLDQHAVLVEHRQNGKQKSNVRRVGTDVVKSLE